MPHVLYLKSDPQNPQGLPAHLLQSQKFDALYCDVVGDGRALHTCISHLKAGDTLFLEREADLARTLSECITTLRDLAQRGVHVWINRIRRIFLAGDSPFLSGISTHDAESLRHFHTSFLRQRDQKEESSETDPETSPVGRPRIVLPEGFEDAKNDWLQGKTTSTEAASRCGMALSTFRKWAKHTA